VNELIKKGIFFDLTSRARFSFTGSDRERFLQGQVSNDVRMANPKNAIYCAVMSSKGKMNGDGFIHKSHDSIIFDTELSLRDSLKERFERFIIADDVELQDTTDETCQFHLLVPESQLSGLHLPLVESARLGIRGYDFFAPAVSRNALLEQFAAAGLTHGDETLYEITRIEQGIARYGQDMEEDTIPNEAGLETRAISYHKGCYIGQEVISRIKSVGRVNWSWNGFLIDSPTPLPTDTKIVIEEKEIGLITSSCYSKTLSRMIGLGYLRRGHENAGMKYLTQSNIKVEVTPLPFIKETL